MKEALIIFGIIMAAFVVIKITAFYLVNYLHKKKCGGKLIVSNEKDSQGNVAYECDKCHKLFWI